MIGQKENIGLAVGTGDDQKVEIGNPTSTEAKAEIENKTGNLKKKVSLCEILRHAELMLSPRPILSVKD